MIGSEPVSLQFLGEKEPNKREHYARRFVLKGWVDVGGEALLKTVICLNRREGRYFHAHPLHAVFSLNASFAAVLILAS